MARLWHEDYSRWVTDLAACRRLLMAGSKTFYAASRLLPERIRTAATVLYAFCRIADDTVDEDGGTVESVDGLHAQLDLVYAGRPRNHPVDRALSRVVVEYGIPREVLDALLEGIVWDAEGRDYHTISDLNAYAARVAGAVGAMTCLLMDRRNPDVLARACDLGVAMQFTNIARDVGEDARNGRLYLPRDWMRDAGLDPDAWLADPVFDDRLASVIQRLLATADVLYKRAEMGITRLPLACRPAIFAARYFYAEIGRELERKGLNSVKHRAIVPGRRKATLLIPILASAALPSGWRAIPALDETQFLVTASSGEHPGLAGASPAWWALNKRVERTLDLFMRLKRQEQARTEAALQAPRPAA